MLINAIKREKKQLREEGIAIGMERGMEKTMNKIAKLMLANGEPMEKIVQYTGLSAQAIRKLKTEKKK